MARQIDLLQIGEVFDDQVRKLVAETTVTWYNLLVTRKPERYGTPKDTGVLAQGWQKDISNPYTGKIFNSVEYAEPVIYGTNLPPSWQAATPPGWRTLRGAIQNFPDELAQKEITVKYVPKLFRKIQKGG